MSTLRTSLLHYCQLYPVSPKDRYWVPSYLFCMLMIIIQSMTDLNLIMFADDTNIFATGYCPIVLSNILNDKLHNINQWFSANLLSLNLNKTCFIIFSKRQIANNAISIAINGVPLQQVHETKFLGVVISDHLKWKK